MSPEKAVYVVKSRTDPTSAPNGSGTRHSSSKKKKTEYSDFSVIPDVNGKHPRFPSLNTLDWVEDEYYRHLPGSRSETASSAETTNDITLEGPRAG